MTAGCPWGIGKICNPVLLIMSAQVQSHSTYCIVLDCSDSEAPHCRLFNCVNSTKNASAGGCGSLDYSEGEGNRSRFPGGLLRGKHAASKDVCCLASPYVRCVGCLRRSHPAQPSGLQVRRPSPLILYHCMLKKNHQLGSGGVAHGKLDDSTPQGFTMMLS